MDDSYAGLISSISELSRHLQSRDFQNQIHELVDSVSETTRITKDLSAYIRNMNSGYAENILAITDVYKNHILTQYDFSVLTKELSHYLRSMKEIRDFSEYTHHLYSEIVPKTFASQSVSSNTIQTLFEDSVSVLHSLQSESDFDSVDKIELSEPLADFISGIDSSLDFSPSEDSKVMKIEKSDNSEKFFNVLNMIFAIITILLTIYFDQTNTALSEQQHADLMYEQQQQTDELKKQTIEEQKQTIEKQKQTELLQQISDAMMNITSNCPKCSEDTYSDLQSPSSVSQVPNSVSQVLGSSLDSIQ